MNLFISRPSSAIFSLSNMCMIALKDGRLSEYCCQHDSICSIIDWMTVLGNVDLLSDFFRAHLVVQYLFCWDFPENYSIRVDIDFEGVLRVCEQIMSYPIRCSHVVCHDRCFAFIPREKEISDFWVSVVIEWYKERFDVIVYDVAWVQEPNSAHNVLCSDRHFRFVHHFADIDLIDPLCNDALLFCVDGTNKSKEIWVTGRRQFRNLSLKGF